MLKFPSIPFVRLLTSLDYRCAFLQKRAIVLRLLIWHVLRLFVLALIVGAWWVLSSAWAMETPNSSTVGSASSVSSVSSTSSVRADGAVNAEGMGIDSERVLIALPLFTERDVESFTLPPLALARKPLSEVQSLEPQEVMFCMLLTAESLPYDDKLSKICKSNLSQSLQPSLQTRLEPYKALLSFLKAFRFKNEANFTDYEYEQAFSVSANRESGRAFLTSVQRQDIPPQGSTLNDLQNQQCFILEQAYIDLKTLISLSYPLKLANGLVETYNQHCAGRVSPVKVSAKVDLNAESFLSTKIQLAELRAMLVVDTVEFVQPEKCLVPNESTPEEVMRAMQDHRLDKRPQLSFLYPFNGTPEQQTSELLEVQQYLIQLGSLQETVSDTLNDSILQALESFAHSLALTDVDEPSFTTLLYLRLFTVGYQPSLYRNPVSQVF